MTEITKLWAIKHRPTTIDDYIFQDKNQKLAFLRMIAEQSIPHLLLSGVQGTGKTTIAKILINEMNIDEMDVITINASDENSVDVIRDKIKNFVLSYAMSKFKIVHLEEADYLTPNGQAVLRVLMEEYADHARFVLTCNYEHRIIPAIRSRCQHHRFKTANKDDIAEYAVKILANEHVTFDLDLIDEYIAAYYPDIRAIVNALQQNTIDGELHKPSATSGGAGDYKFDLIEHIETDDWLAARKLACGSVAAEEWEDVYRFLYDNIDKAPKFKLKEKYESGIVIIADHLYKNGVTADPEINAAAMFIRLSQL